MSTAAALQSAVVGALNADADLVALVGGRIYGDPPIKPDYPLIRIGRIEHSPEDTDGEEGHSYMLSVEVHDRPTHGGRIRCTKIVDKVRGVIHRPATDLTAGGYLVYNSIEVSAAVERERDGLGYIGIATFELSLCVQ